MSDIADDYKNRNQLMLRRITELVQSLPPLKNKDESRGEIDAQLFMAIAAYMGSINAPCDSMLGRVAMERVKRTLREICGEPDLTTETETD